MHGSLYAYIIAVGKFERWRTTKKKNTNFSLSVDEIADKNNNRFFIQFYHFTTYTL